jgi:cytochrome c-type biogenesis protein
VEELFASLSHAVEGSPLLAVAASFAWGVLSIVLSPCHLASIPLIIGFISGQGTEITTRRAFVLSSLFASGILITIGAIGGITAAAGRMMGDIGVFGNYFVAVIFLVVGLHLLGVFPIPWSAPGRIGTKRQGAAAALLLGLVFGIALGPCTFAYMAPMLAVTFKLASTAPAWGILLLVVYGAGHCSVIVGAGTCTEIVQRYLHWTDRSRGAAILRGGRGILVILGGLYLLYAAP